MKVLRIIASMNPKSGGPAQGIRTSVLAMAKRGITSMVVCLDGPQAEYLTEDTIPITALGPARGPWQKNQQLEHWLLKNLCSYDAVIVHGLWLYPNFAVRKVCDRLRKEKPVPPVYFMPHGMLDPYFQQTPERRLKAIRNFVYWKLVESKNVHSADGLLFTCEQEMLLARQSFQPYRPTSEHNTGYGIAPPPPPDVLLDEAFYAACTEVKEVPYLLFISRIHPKKGVDLLIAAFAKAVNSLPAAQHLVIAGPGMDTAYGAKLKAMVASLEIGRRVHFPGMLKGDAKWGAFYNAEAFILPSHQENFGIAVVEALACHTPVLISDKVNIWREIDALGAGFVGEDSESGAFTIIEKWIHTSDADKGRMRQNAFSAYTKHFSIHGNIDKLIGVLKAGIHDGQKNVQHGNGA